MKRVAIIQARMTSTRLPGKVLMDLAGQPMLVRQLERLRHCRALDELVLATTVNASDDPVVRVAEEAGARVFRGDEHDVLERFCGAARASQADLIVRLTADCPLLDPEVIDRVVEELVRAPADYASNTRVRRYPRGLDAEALWADVLFRMARLGQSREAREHVTWFLHRERPELFVCRDVVGAADHSDLRWTVDTEDDLALVRAIYAAGELTTRPLPFPELVALVRSRPELMAMNAHVRQATL